MLMKWLMGRRLAAFERANDYDATYLHEVLEADPRAMKLFAGAMAVGGYCRDLPQDAWHAAKITGLIVEDCGPCTQLAVSLAERAGVDPDLLRAVVARDFEALPEPVALACRFAEATMARDPAADALRERIVGLWGRGALVTLAFSVLAARIFPTLKYAMGHGQACVRVSVGGAPVPVLRLAA